MQEKGLFLKRFCEADGCGKGPETQTGQRFQPIASSLLSSLPSSLLKRSKRQKESGDGAVSSNRKNGPKNVKTRMNTGFHAGWAMAEAVGFEPTRAFTLPDFEFFENLGKHRKSVSYSRKITEAQKRGSARLSSATYNPKAAQTQENHRLEIGSKVLSKFSPGGQKSGTLERTQERTHPTKGSPDTFCP